jgi:pentatricopeptide repeat protein
LREALAISHEDTFGTIELLTRLAAVEQSLGHLDEAEAVLRRAELLGVQDTGQLASITEIRGRIQRSQGNAGIAVDRLRAALATLDAEGHDGYGVRTRVVAELARSLDAVGRTDEALSAYRSAISAIETRRNELGADAIGRSAFLADFVAIYVELVDALVKRGRIDEAFDVAEQMRARSLREAIDESKIDRSATLSVEERSREAALVVRVVEINKKLMTARKSGDEATEKIGRCASHSTRIAPSSASPIPRLDAVASTARRHAGCPRARNRLR